MPTTTTPTPTATTPTPPTTARKITSLWANHDAIVPCICVNCRTAILALSDGEARWARRVARHRELVGKVRRGLHLSRALERGGEGDGEGVVASVGASVVGVG